MTGQQPDQDPYRWPDDLMAIADATGVTAQEPWAMRDDVLAAVLANWSRAAAGLNSTELDPFDIEAVMNGLTMRDPHIGLDIHFPNITVPVVDHGPCENPDCGRTICACLPTHKGPCPGTTEQACPHHSLLCDDCRHECPDCRIDAAETGWDQ